MQVHIQQQHKFEMKYELDNTKLIEIIVPPDQQKYLYWDDSTELIYQNISYDVYKQFIKNGNIHILAKYDTDENQLFRNFEQASATIENYCLEKNSKRIFFSHLVVKEFLVNDKKSNFQICVNTKNQYNSQLHFYSVFHQVFTPPPQIG